MTPEDLRLIGGGLFADNTTLSLKDRTLINFQWAVVGRISDITNLEFCDLLWVNDAILINIVRKKVAEQQSLSILCSALMWEIDPFHSLATQLATDPFNPSSRVFPQVAISESGECGSAHTNKVLAALSTSSSCGGQLTPGLRTHSARRGAATHAASNSGLSLADVAHRGKWSMEQMMKLFVYIASTTKGDLKVARVISGWKVADAVVHSPHLAPGLSSRADADPNDSNLQQKFALSLFDKALDRLKPHKFIFTLTASLLMYFEETYRRYPAHILHSKMISVVRSVVNDGQCGEEDALNLLREWSIAVRTRFVQDNVLSLPIGVVADSLTDTARAAQFVGAHTFKETLVGTVATLQSIAGATEETRLRLKVVEDTNEKLVVANKQLATSYSKLAASYEHLVASIEKSMQRMENTITEPERRTIASNSLQLLQPPKWPRTLNKLGGVSLSTLICQYLEEDLEAAPYDRKNRAQTECKRAMVIAFGVMGDRKPMPFRSLSDDATRAKWRAQAQQIAQEVENEIVEQLSDGKRKRKPYITGIVKACDALKSTKRKHEDTTSGNDSYEQ
ncbi:hypothetical protein GN958_ATG00514 [Phytophthora infestans]|nr:hypothetical protein GN958_ATG00514 [Phytophthora infestans]